MIIIPNDGTLICGLNFQHQQIGESIWDFLKLEKIKKKKTELEMEMERTTPQSWKINNLRMIRHKEQNSLIRT